MLSASTRSLFSLPRPGEGHHSRHSWEVYCPFQSRLGAFCPAPAEECRG